MKEIIKTVYIICNNEKQVLKETIQEAEETKTFLEDILGTTFTIKEDIKSFYDIEKGDKVYWLENGKPNTKRIDIVTDIVKNAFGDKQYLTKELNGNRIGTAYDSYICLVM